MKEILIGTSGYAYKDWIGAVYPEGTVKSAFYGAKLNDLAECRPSRRRRRTLIDLLCEVPFALFYLF